MKVVFKPGEIVCLYGGKRNYYRIIRPHDENDIGTQLEISLKSFEKHEGYARPSEDYNWEVKPATYEEIQWLEACEKANKYVPKPVMYYEIY